jgi:hypothetical protein
MKKDNVFLIDVAISGDRNVIQTADEKILKCTDLIYSGNAIHVEFSNKTDTSNKRGNRIHSKTYRKYVNIIPGNQWQRAAAENGHSGHCANTAGGANVKVQSF